MLHEEGALADLPERPAAAQMRKQLGLGVGEPEQLPRVRELVGRLRVDDLRLGVGEQPFGEAELAASLGAGGAQVGEAVQDDDVLRAEARGRA